MKNLPVIRIVFLLFLLSSGCTNTSNNSKDMEQQTVSSKDTTNHQIVTSNDGTSIAYDKTGTGPVLIIVNGALSHRTSPGIHELADSLAPNFTVITFDRRGRGDSGDTKPYTSDREIEDIEALINDAGGGAYVYGSSSGAALALLTAEKLGPGKVKKLAMYEPPYGAVSDEKYTEEKNQIKQLIEANKPEEAVTLFMGNRGTPPDQMEAMKKSPEWNDMVRTGPTLVYDFEVMGTGKIPEDRAKILSIPTMVMTGEKSPEFMHTTADSLVKIIPGAIHKILPGQTHQASPAAAVPVLLEFFRS